MYDVIVIGGGVTGCAIARELSRFRVNACVLEKNQDVCEGTSKANSGIVHAGYDARSGTWKAKMNVDGARRMPGLSKELDFPYKQNGSLVICRNREQIGKLEELLERGRKNGVEQLEILGEEELHVMEPHLSRDSIAGLYAPGAGIVCPFGLTIALAENAYTNGVAFFFQTRVTEIQRAEEGFVLNTTTGEFRARTVVNAAGVYADIFHNMVSARKLRIIPRKGEYCLLDRSAGDYVGRTIFQLPTAKGKGVLVAPTVHGNLLVGPTAWDQESREDTQVGREGFEALTAQAAHCVAGLPLRETITSFAGLRAHESGDDFVLGELEECPGFFDAVGIESPGLTAAPAIGAYIARQLKEKLGLEPNPGFVGTRKGILRPETLSLEERKRLIARRPEYGDIICRCNTVSAGEILDAIRRPLGAATVDGIKRRTTAGMGRCQAGFCTQRTLEILAEELGTDMLSVTKSGGNSRYLVGKNKEQEGFTG